MQLLLVLLQRHYIENASGRLLDRWRRKPSPPRRDRPVAAGVAPPTDFPPRPSHGTAAHRDLAGYCAARADFEFEPDNAAELEVVGVDCEDVEKGGGVTKLDEVFCSFANTSATERPSHRFSGYQLREKLLGDSGNSDDDHSLSCLLQMASVEVYNNRLCNRRRLKRSVRELGLLNRSKVAGTASRQEQLGQMGGPAYAKLGRFAHLACAFDHDFVLEGLRHELALRQSVLHLQEFRRNGLTRAGSTAFFAKLRRQREISLREVPTERVADWMRAGCFDLAPSASASGTASGTAASSLVSTARRTAPPLDLVGLPGAARLSEEERALCSQARVMPETYFEVRAAMVEECEGNGGLRLADARPLAKMDVNKTRKVYDFLLGAGVIWKSQSHKNNDGN